MLRSLCRLLALFVTNFNVIPLASVLQQSDIVIEYMYELPCSYDCWPFTVLVSYNVTKL